MGFEGEGLTSGEEHSEYRGILLCLRDNFEHKSRTLRKHFDGQADKQFVFPGCMKDSLQSIF